MKLARLAAASFLLVALMATPAQAAKTTPNLMLQPTWSPAYGSQIWFDVTNTNTRPDKMSFRLDCWDDPIAGHLVLSVPSSIHANYTTDVFTLATPSWTSEVGHCFGYLSVQAPSSSANWLFYVG
jgi:hypothetical protein